MAERRSQALRRAAADRRTGDRRGPQRVVAAARVRFVRSGEMGQVLDGRLLDASATGLRLASRESPGLGERLLVEASIESRHLFNATAEVAWVRPRDDGEYEVGCELRVDLTLRQAALLRRMARKQTG